MQGLRSHSTQSRVVNGTIGLQMVQTVPLGEQMVPLALPLVPMVLPMVPLL